MDTELLKQILILVSILAVAILIAVFWRLYDILGDVKTVSRLSAKRAEQVDGMITKFEQSVTDYLDSFKVFLSSLGFIKNIRNYFDNNKKGDQDGQG